MNHIKSIVRMICFVLCFSVLFTTASYLIKPDNTNTNNIISFYSLQKETIDVLYVGGSAAFVYYAGPYAWEKYGIASYDYAADTMQLELYKCMITEALKTQSPKLIIIDARVFQYRDKDNVDAQPPGEVPYRNTLTGMRLSKNKVEFIDKYIDGSMEDRVPYYFDICKYHSNINLSPVNFKTKLKQMAGSSDTKYNGFLFVKKYSPMSEYDHLTDEKKPFSKETYDILMELLDYLDQINIDVLFTVSPYCEKKEHKMIFNYVQPILESRGYDFIDCNDYFDQMGLDFKTDFYHEGHVNIYGAEKYTDFLSHFIINQYNIPDRSDDPHYNGFNQCLANWHEDTALTKEFIDSEIEIYLKEESTNEK